jgi:PKD domain/CHAP domain
MAFAVLPVALFTMAVPTARAATGPGSGTGGDTAALAAIYVAARHLPPGTLATIRAGSLRTGTADGATWAIADFTPAPSDTAAAQTAFQDGASGAVFRQVPGKAWQLVQAGPYGCGFGLPAALVTSFGLANPAICHTSRAANVSAARQAPRGTATTGQKIAGIALSQIGVGITPPSPYFGIVDCDPYSTLVGAQSPNADGCGLNSGFNIENQNEEWCSDFAKWVWQQAGVTVDMNTLNAGSVSSYDWGLDQKENVTPDTGTPAVGDAVVFFPPGTITPATYADHVGIVTGINPDGTINMANGDFSGDQDIDVQYDTEISLTSWASAVWYHGEQWVLISPPGAAQQPAPQVTLNGPSRAVAGTSLSFTASAPGATQYLWTFGDGRADNVPGASVSHVYAENGTYPVTVSVTSGQGTVTTKAMDVTVTGASSAVAGVPVDQLWYSPTPVDQYLFLRSSSGGLAAETWDGASWLQHAVPGTPDGQGGITALSYPDPAVSDAMTPHAYYSSGGTLTQTYLGGSGWTTATLAGRPAGGSAVVADSTAAGPAVFYFGSGGQLATSSDQGGGWAASAVGGPAASSLGSLALADTVDGPELFYLGGKDTLTMASRGAAGGWQTTRIPTPLGIAANSPLAAVTTGPSQVSVFFTDANGKLTAATPEGAGWAVVPVAGAPAPATALAATRYLTGPQSTAGAATGTGTEVFALTGSGQPSVSYSTSASGVGGWRSVSLPGAGSGILAADAYQNAGEPSQLFLSGPLSADQAGTPGGSWSSATLPATPATLADSVVLYAATSSDDTAALAAASAAGLPASQVTTSFATAWADTLTGSYLVISVGLAATDALYYNVCGWANPSGEIPGSTPFYIAGGPLNSLPGPDAYESAAAATAAQTPALATDLAYYAAHGQLPAGVSTLPSAAAPAYACSGTPGTIG